VRNGRFGDLGREVDGRERERQEGRDKRMTLPSEREGQRERERGIPQGEEWELEEGET
jgi:hypothetical protein